VLTLLLALALGFVRPAAPAALPAHGVLVPFRSLAGVRLGDTATSVRSRLGARYRPCGHCAATTWYFTRTDTSPGLAVVFRRGRVAAVSTLGAPIGWRTSDGLRVGEGVERVQSVYGTLDWRICIGYGALTMRRRQVVTSIYTSGDVVYGFGLSRPAEPICV
jgi:hypothetical protein